MNHIIITGASRGFGQAIAHEMATDTCAFHLIARSKCEKTKDLVLDNYPEAQIFSYQCDLSDTNNLGDLTDKLKPHIDANADRITLINNAGTLHPIGPAGKYQSSDYHKNIELNFVAPVMLSHWFLEQYQDLDIPKLIVCISSGAANHPYQGWSHYCSTKAGVDMFVKTVALEQKEMENPIDIIGFNPSRIETAMQAQIREQDESDFAEVADFRKSATDGRNNSPQKLAQALRVVIEEQKYSSGEIVRGKDHLVN